MTKQVATGMTLAVALNHLRFHWAWVDWDKRGRPEHMLGQIRTEMTDEMVISRASALTDDDLLRIRLIGKKKLALIRAAISDRKQSGVDVATGYDDKRPWRIH